MAVSINVCEKHKVAYLGFCLDCDAEREFEGAMVKLERETVQALMRDPERHADPMVIEANNRHVVRRGAWFAVLFLLLLLATACADTCGYIEGPHLTIGEGPTGCWVYTGEPKCTPALADESPCDKRELFHTGDKLILWCEPDVVAPKAVMVPAECEVVK